MNNPTRQMKLVDLAEMVEARRRFEGLSPAEKIESKLAKLKVFVDQLGCTEQGRLDLQMRETLLGPCDRESCETPGDYYGRLRRWVDKDITTHVRYQELRSRVAESNPSFSDGKGV